MTDASKAGAGDARRGSGELPATGDATVLVAMGTIALAGTALGVTLYKKRSR